MAEEIFPGLYRIPVPIPENPLKELNSYVIRGRERSLVIDTGMNRPECESALHRGLGELGVDLERTDLFITHLHADHSGLIAGLTRENTSVYCSGPDAEIINSDDSHWEQLRVFVLTGGFPAAEFDRAIRRHPGFRYRCREVIDFTVVADGDSLTVGDYNLRCVWTPGHTAGHMCLYEPDKKILISGDHILGDITPNISLWSDDEDPLADYLASLDKTGRLDIRTVLPAHRSQIHDCHARIAELKKHHRVRADEVLTVLEQGEQNAYQVASQMTWDMTYDSFALFPVSQKWFAAGEALAHLKFLEGEGKVRRELKDGCALFSLVAATRTG
jgi:glyoxylase-like metal-dependent hydrolase (beta-lactamase superfamily II)